MAKQAKTIPTAANVRAFIDSVEHEGRREDAQALVTIFEQATGWKAQMWGPSIIGFGRYSYTYASGHSGEMCVVGFSPRKANMALYINGSSDESRVLIAKLGKVKTGASCIYANRLSDIDVGVLQKLIKASVAATKNKWAVSAK